MNLLILLLGLNSSAWWMFNKANECEYTTITPEVLFYQAQTQEGGFKDCTRQDTTGFSVLIDCNKPTKMMWLFFNNFASCAVFKETFEKKRGKI